MPSSIRSCASCGGSQHFPLGAQPLSPLNAIPTPAHFPYLAESKAFCTPPPVPSYLSSSPHSSFNSAAPSPSPPSPLPVHCNSPAHFCAGVVARSPPSRQSQYSILEPMEQGAVYQEWIRPDSPRFTRSPSLRNVAATNISVESPPGTPALSASPRASSASAASSPVPPHLTRHRQFYFTSDLITLKVSENTNYRTRSLNSIFSGGRLSL